MNFARPSTLLFGLGMTLSLAGFVLGCASDGWKLTFSRTPTFYALAGSGAVCAYLSLHLIRREGRQRQEREAHFLEELHAVADDLTMADPEDRLEDLCLFYDEEERADILARLKRRPKRQRRLRLVLDDITTGVA